MGGCLHMGQELAILSHLVMQALWYLWLHGREIQAIFGLVSDSPLWT